MKNIVPLFLFAAIAANVVAQSGRKVVRPAKEPTPPVQAPVFSQPDPELERLWAIPTPMPTLPEGLRKRPLKALDNSTFRLADFSDKVIVVNLWASWCGPCRHEVPEYEKVRKEYTDRNVEFIGLTPENPRTSAGRVKEFVRSVNFGFRLGWADRETAKTLSNGGSAVPQTLVIAADGRIVSRWDGYSRGLSGDRLRAALEQALAHASARL
jgi:thiol-disulfide isomerase/thioredoxin